MSSSAPDSLVLSEQNQEGIVTLTMNSPKLNLLNLEMLEQLRTKLKSAIENGCSGIVLTGANACFCAGLDTRALASYDSIQQRQIVEHLNAFVRELYGAPVPTVAAVHGHALAGGLIFALACDRRFVTSEKCRLGLPEVQAGVPYPAVPLLVAKAELGPALTRTLALGGNPLLPQEAVDLGLFDESLAAADVLERARAEADVLAGHPAYARVKAQLRTDVCAQADQVIEAQSDPMLKSWV